MNGKTIDPKANRKVTLNGTRLPADAETLCAILARIIARVVSRDTVRQPRKRDAKA
jgi:hypothetical protein